jgi:hypothetical protein
MSSVVGSNANIKTGNVSPYKRRELIMNKICTGLLYKKAQSKVTANKKQSNSKQLMQK